MADEYDAFGRKKDDAGLGDLGWGTSSDTPPATTQVAPPREVETGAPVATPGRRPRGSGLAFAWIIALVVVGGVGLAVFSMGKDANDAVRDTLNSFKTQTSPTGGVGTQGDSGDDDVPAQVKAASFFTPKGLRAGLRILAKEQPGRIANYSMRKDRIDVQIIRGGKTHIVELQAGAEAPQEFSSSTAVSGADSISYEELNATAPNRLMRAANARLSASPKQVDYFVAQKFSGTLQWGIYYKNGRIAQGDSRGRFTRRIS